MSIARCALLAAISLTACASSSGGAGAPTVTVAVASSAPVIAASAPPVPAAAPTVPTVQYFEKKAKKTLRDGSEVTVTTAYLKRTLDPANGVIVEELLAVPRTGEKPKEVVTTMKVEGARFTLSEASHAFEGTGTLSGDPWRWTRWTAHVVFANGSTVDETNTLTATGFTSEKHAEDKSGLDGRLFLETYRSIARERYEALRDALLVTPIGLDPTAPPAPKKP